MRVLGVDVGLCRIGLAMSDDSAVLATPWQTVPAAPTAKESARQIAALLDEARRDDRVVDRIVIGLPKRLGGDDTTLTAHVRAFANDLRDCTGLDVHLQDERLTSHEADMRLALGERDWRRRKAKLDAAAAAIILQDFLDARTDNRRAGHAPDSDSDPR